MGITYDAPSNTITVTGYTSGTPCTFTDIYNADVGGGWGVVSLQGTTQFLFACFLQIGDGWTTTWFADTHKQVTFTVGVYPNNIIYVEENAHFRLGILDNLATKAVSRGCDLFWQSAVYERVYLRGNVNSEVYLYASTFRSGSHADTVWEIGGSGDFRMWSCSVHGGTVGPVSATGDVSDITITRGDKALTDVTAGASIDDIHVETAKHAIAMGANNVFTNIVSRNLQTSLVKTWGASGYLVDCDADAWTITFSGAGIIYRQYTVNLHVVDLLGVNMGSASAVWADKNGTPVFSVSTAADGTITEQTVSRGYYNQANGNTLQDYGPFTLTVSKAGYMPYVHTGIVLDEPVDWRLYLRTQLSGDADAEHVLAGKTFYKDDADTKLTGTSAPPGGGGASYYYRNARPLAQHRDHLLTILQKEVRALAES